VALSTVIGEYGIPAAEPMLVVGRTVGGGPHLDGTDAHAAEADALRVVAETRDEPGAVAA
jgi:hypothetical protein